MSLKMREKHKRLVTDNLQVKKESLGEKKKGKKSSRRALR